MKAFYDNANQLTDEKRAELRQDWYEHIKDEANKLLIGGHLELAFRRTQRRIAKAYNQLTTNLK